MIFIIQIEILDFKSAKPLQIIDLVKTPATAPEHEAREKMRRGKAGRRVI